MSALRRIQLFPFPSRCAGILAAAFAAAACGDGASTPDDGTGGSAGTGGAGGSAGTGGSAGNAGSAGTSGSELPAPTLEDAECDPAEVDEIPPEIEYSCHWLTVPEHRGDRYDGDTLRLSVTVMRSPAANPAPDPIVYVSGGPGGRGGWPNAWSKAPFLEHRDLIVYEQRGTGASEPDMECPEMERAMVGMFQANDDPAAEEAAVSTAVRACADRLTAAGVDVTAFSTPYGADDLEDLRIALGVESWNVLGISYGSRLTQELMRRHPEGIRSVILDSTYPMGGDGLTRPLAGADRAVSQLAAGCAADADCSAAHPDLAAEIDDLVARYNASPYSTNVDLGGDLGPTDIVITGNDVAAGIFNAMYDSNLIVALPTLVTALSNGQTAIADQIAIRGINFIIERAEGMALATDCTDRAPRVSSATDGALPPDVGRWATVASLLMSQHCDVWPAGVGDPRFGEPVTSDLPVLILSGTADPVTPTPGARTVAEHLSNGTFVTFESFGHGVWPTSDCATGITMSFVEDPTTPPDVSCAAALGSRDFTP